MNISQELQDKIKILKQKGVVLTTPRLIILDFLLKNRSHPTAEDVFNALKEKFPSISQASVYNTLKLFTKLGIVTELSIEKEKARYDINLRPHAHFKCLKCGEVYDLFEISKLEMEKMIIGHKVLTAQFYFYGICNKCLRLKLSSEA